MKCVVCGKECKTGLCKACQAEEEEYNVAERKAIKNKPRKHRVKSDWEE